MAGAVPIEIEIKLTNDKGFLKDGFLITFSSNNVDINKYKISFKIIQRDVNTYKNTIYLSKHIFEYNTSGTQIHLNVSAPDFYQLEKYLYRISFLFVEITNPSDTNYKKTFYKQLLFYYSNNNNDDFLYLKVFNDAIFNIVEYSLVDNINSVFTELVE